MPTLKRRVDPTATLHPRQTEYYILAKPPDVGNITYQVDSRAVNFLTEVRGYSSGDQLPWSVVHPLRQVRDLYTLDEGRPRPTDDIDQDEVTNEVTLPSLEEPELRDLAEYLREHPDVVGDVDAFEAQIREQKANYLDTIERAQYTPESTPGHDGSGNETLDRIASTYFGDASEDYIEWNGDRVYDYIEVTDRTGETHKFPHIETRLPEGERYRFSQDLYERWGPQIGASDVNSRRYELGDEKFPNHWIGQTPTSPEPSLEDADSPRAFFYRTLAGKGHFAPGKEAEEEFREACEYSLEVYKANFPTAVDPNDLETEYGVVEKATKPWNDFQVPPSWQEEYADGVPPLKRESPIANLDTEGQRLFERHGPGGEGPQWFDSVDQAVSLLDFAAIREMIRRMEETSFDILDIRRDGGGYPILTLEAKGTEVRTEVVDMEKKKWVLEIPSRIGRGHNVRVSDGFVELWNYPDHSSPKETHAVLSEQVVWFSLVAKFANAFEDW